MGIGKFQPLTKSIPLNQSTKNSAQLITSARRGDPVYQIWCKSTHWGLLGKWVKYNKNYFLFISFFSGTRTGQIGGWIFTCDSSKDVKSRKDVPFGGLNDVPQNFGVKLHVRQIRTGKWLSTVRTRKVTVLYFRYNPCTRTDVIYRAHAVYFRFCVQCLGILQQS